MDKTDAECKVAISDLCFDYEKGVGFVTDERIYGSWMLGLIITSFCGNALLAYVIYVDKKLQAHPMRLFMSVALLDAALFWNIGSINYICSAELNVLLIWSLGMEYSLNVDYVLFQVVGNFYLFMNSFLWSSSLVLNICLCIDLVKTVKYPFSMKDSRLRKYLIISFASGLLSGFERFYSIEYIKGHGEEDDIQRLVSILVTCLSELALFAIFSVAGIFSCVYAYLRLNKPGVSQEVRQLILRRHITYIIFYMFCNLFFMGSEYLYIRKNNSSNNYEADGKWFANLKEENPVSYWVIYAFEILFYGQGLFIPLTRLSEPYFFTLALSNIKKCFKCKKEQVEEDQFRFGSFSPS